MRHFASILRSALALLCIVSLALGAAAMAEGTLEEAGGTLQTLSPTSGEVAVQQTFSDLLKNSDGKYEHYYSVVYSGYFDLPMVLNGESSPAIEGEQAYDLRMYIPENSRYSQSSMLVVVPSDTDPYAFMEASGWKEVADAQHVTIFLLMPGRVTDESGTPTAWGSWTSYDDAAFSQYVSGAVSVIGQRPGIQTVSYCEYIIGYGDAADLVTKYVMQSPTTFAGAFSVGSTGAMAEIAADAPSREAGVPLSAVPLPFGVVTDGADVTALVDFFKAANATLADAATAGDFTYYAPDPAAAVGQPDSEPVAGVYVLNAATEDCLNADFAAYVYDILKTVRRYPGYGNSELRAYEDVYASPDYEYHTSLSATGEYTYGGDIAAEGDGNWYNREWWLYVPQSARDRMDAGEQVEVLYLFMGSNGYGDEIAQRTGWDDVASDEAFIIVSPSGHIRHQGNFGNFTRNGVNVYQYCTNWNWGDGATEILPDDLLMVEHIHDWLLNQSAYAGKVDPGRVYASGQSAGGAFTHHVAKKLPDMFAAAAPCSWVDSGEGALESSDVALAVWMGQGDTTIRGALSVENAQMMFDYYIGRFGGLTDDAGRGAWADFTFMQEAEGGVSDATALGGGSYGTFNEYILRTPKGYAMFVGAEVVGLTHATVPDECVSIWNDFFSHFSKDVDTKVLSFDGNAVDTPINASLAK